MAFTKGVVVWRWFCELFVKGLELGVDVLSVSEVDIFDGKPPGVTGVCGVVFGRLEEKEGLFGGEDEQSSSNCRLADRKGSYLSLGKPLKIDPTN